MNPWLLKSIVQRALQEDIGTGDVTTEGIVSPNLQASGRIKSKDQGILAGLEVVQLVFQLLDASVAFETQKKDGDPLQPGDPILEIKGSARALLSGERVALNLLQRLSGIATQTQRFVRKTTGYPAQIIDTRKTTPGLRILDKYAVRVGGGINHRFGLYDAVLIKDNHIQIAGGIKPAVAAVRQNLSHTLKIEVEAESLGQVLEALDAHVDIILLDNMSATLLRQAVALVREKEKGPRRVLLEASGGIKEEQVADIAATGVDLISIGALTHSARALDLSMDIIL